MFLKSIAKNVVTGTKTLESNVITKTQLNANLIVLLNLAGVVLILSTRELIVFSSVGTG